MQENLLKITNAVYRILDFLPDSDPLKNKAKEKALAILENPELGDIETLEKYLELAKLQGWIDGMNFLIITKEYRQIKEQISLLGLAVKKSVVKTSSTSTPKVESYSKRQEKILGILSEKEKLQVKDILQEIPDVTKRTLRRDLDDLLKRGSVIRTGEFNRVFYQKAGRT